MAAASPASPVAETRAASPVQAAAETDAAPAEAELKTSPSSASGWQRQQSQESLHSRGNQLFRGSLIAS